MRYTYKIKNNTVTNGRTAHEGKIITATTRVALPAGCPR